MRKGFKLFSSILSTAMIATPIATTVSCSSNMSVGFKIAIFNYKDYTSDDSKETMSKYFNYKEFNDLPDFSQALQANKTIGGVGSDYYNAKLALGGYIKPLNFRKALHIDYRDKADLENILRTRVYTAAAWKQMSYFDSLLADARLDNDQDGQVDKLWEYMIPYYMQNKVLVFNVNRPGVHWSDDELAKLDDPTKINEVFEQTVNGEKRDRTYVGLLKTLKDHGYTNFVVNDYMRDNMIIGSETNGKLSGKVASLDVAKEQLEGFKNTFIQGAGFNPFTEKKHVKFEASGGESLSSIIDPEKDWQASFLYNGDAIDAYYSNDNFDSLEDGKDIRFVEPKNPVYLLDGVVLSSMVSEETEDKFYDAIYNSWFKGWSGHEDENFIKPAIKWDSDDDGIHAPAIANNFDFVNYTIPFRDVYDRLTDPNSDDFYFDGDPVAAKMFEIYPGQDENKVSFPISDILQTNLNEYYNSLKRQG